MCVYRGLSRAANFFTEKDQMSTDFYTDFHTRFLAKASAMDVLAKLAGFVDSATPLTVTAERLERTASDRRAVVLSLIKDGYLESPPIGSHDFVVTQKAFTESEWEPYVGELSIGSLDKPLAIWLSGPIIKKAVMDLLDGSATVVDGSRGGKVVVSTLDARGDDERVFDDWLAANLSEVVCAMTDVSSTIGECLKVPPKSVVSLALLESLRKDQDKEIQRLKRCNDAIAATIFQVEEMGGWDVFLAAARSEWKNRSAENFASHDAISAA